MKIQTAFNITRKQAIALMPWAAKIVKVDEGYTGFESIGDYSTWRKQR